MIAEDPFELLFVCSDLAEGEAPSGGSIYDRRLVAALRGLGVEVEELFIKRQRAFIPPLWRTAVSREVKEEVAELAKGRAVVLSHEALFQAGDLLNERDCPTFLIVHNYMPRFDFPGRPLLSWSYKWCSRKFFERFLNNAGGTLFLSLSDLKVARQNHGDMAESKALVFAPPPRPLAVGKRADDIIHLDGSAGWLPKALCQLTGEDLQILERRGYRPSDLDAPLQSGNGLITDRFAIGYKLKLMQMIYAGDVIASFVDLNEDVEQVAPGYPCYRTVKSLEEALDYFDEMKGHVPEEAVAESTKKVRAYDWSDVAREILQNLRRQLATNAGVKS